MQPKGITGAIDADLAVETDVGCHLRFRSHGGVRSVTGDGSDAMGEKATVEEHHVARCNLHSDHLTTSREIE